MMSTKPAAGSDPVLSIAGRPVGAGHPPYVVAELSANHNGALERALASIDAAKAAGADAVKIQTFTPDTITLDSDRPEFLISGGLWDGWRLYDLYRQAQTPYDWHAPLFERARALGITIFSTPFDFSAVDLLESLGAPAYKIASFEIVDLPLLRRVAATGKPVILSTGMATLPEIEEAVTALRGGGCRDLALLHCISSYPAPAEQANLRTIADLAARFEAVPGLSDHSTGTTIAVAAVAQGAALIEKHFMLDAGDGGLDSAFSLTAEDLAELTRACRTAWVALGRVNYQRLPSEAGSLRHRRSLYFAADIKAGERITPDNLRSVRPADGLHPRHYEALLGRRARCDIARATPAAFELTEPAGDESALQSDDR